VTELLDPQGERKYLIDGEQRSLLIEIHSCGNVAQRAFCLTLFYTGARISEVLALRPQRIDFADDKIVFQTLKQRRAIRHRAVPMPPELSSLLRLVIKQNQIGPDDRIWNFSRQHGLNIIKRLMHQAGIYGSRATSRGLRHTYATSNIENGVPLPKLQKWLGHARLENTAIYLDFTGEEERAYAQRRWKKFALAKNPLARKPYKQ